MGLVGKSNGQTRLIFHLSYDFHDGKSINHHIPKELCSVKCNDFDSAIRLCSEIWAKAFMAKSDIKSAFRHLPIKPEDRKWLVMKALNPWNNKTCCFIEKCVSFGCLISCSHFQRVSNAIEFLFRKRSGSKAINYLDDFIFVYLMRNSCNELVIKFIHLCQEINFPLVMDKTEWAMQIITFLGMLISTITQTISIPVEKRNKALKFLADLLNAKKTTVLNMQRLTGLLNYLGKALIPARAFNRHFYAKCKGLKQHHHLRVDSEIKLNSQMWTKFLENDASLYRPFLDFDLVMRADRIDWFTDASGQIGLGGIFNSRWFYALWNDEFLDLQ